MLRAISEFLGASSDRSPSTLTVEKGTSEILCQVLAESQHGFMICQYRPTYWLDRSPDGSLRDSGNVLPLGALHVFVDENGLPSRLPTDEDISARSRGPIATTISQAKECRTSLSMEQNYRDRLISSADGLGTLELDPNTLAAWSSERSSDRGCVSTLIGSGTEVVTLIRVPVLDHTGVEHYVWSDFKVDNLRQLLTYKRDGAYAQHIRARPLASTSTEEETLYLRHMDHESEFGLQILEEGVSFQPLRGTIVKAGWRALFATARGCAA